MKWNHSFGRVARILSVPAALFVLFGCDEPSTAGEAMDDVEGRLEKAELHLEESGSALEGATAKLDALEESIESLKASCATTGEPLRIGLAPAEGEPERCLSAQGAVVPCERGASFMLTSGERPPADEARADASKSESGDDGADDEGESAG